MNSQQLAALRPADASRAAIEQSLGDIREALIVARGSRDALVGMRSSVVLSSDNATVEKHDAKIRAAENDVVRLQALQIELEPKLSVARGQARIEHVRGLHAEAEAATERWRAFWEDQYPALASKIAEGLALEAIATRARELFLNANGFAYRDADVAAAGGQHAPPLQGMPRAYLGPRDAQSPTKLVCLPGAQPGRPIAWPHGRVLEPVKIGLAAAYS